MPTETEDAKLETTESSAVETDAKEKTESSTVKKDAKEPESLQEAIAAAVPSTEKEEEETVTEEKTAVVEEESTTEEKDAEVPFHEHPRWKQVNEELKELRPLAERARALEEKLATVTPEQLDAMVEIAVLMDSDPEKALGKLRPYVEALESAQGLRLPDDIAKKVEDGVIDEETAREVALLRSKREREEKQAQQSAQQQATEAVQSAITAWETATKKNDVAFDKKYPMILDRFLRYCQTERHDGSPKAVVALVQKAYDAVNKDINAFVPKPPAKKVLTSSGSSKQQSEPETFEEAVAAAGAKYREG